MKIVHFFDRVQLERGGTIRAALDMCRVMADRGHDVTLATFDDTDVPTEWRDGSASVGPKWPNVKVISSPSLPGGFYPPGGPTCAKAPLAGADVTHLHGIWRPSTAQFGARAKDAGVPIVVSCHGMLDDWSMRQGTAKKKLYLNFMGQGLFDAVSVFHATADDERRQASNWVPESKIEVVPYITDLTPFDSLPGPEMARDKFSLGDGTGPFTVLFLSRLHYKKQPDVLIKAVALMRERGEDVRVLFAGTGDDPYVAQLKSLAKSSGLTDETCRFLGMVTGDLKHSVYEAADVFALPTSQENFGLVYTESLACETPIVATTGTDIWRELDATGGATIADGTPEGFAEALSALAKRREELPEVGRRGRANVYKWLEPNAIAERFEKMYERARGGVPAGVAS
ncbi:MAG: glycosyltransferase [Planctomycetota bacterium]